MRAVSGVCRANKDHHALHIAIEHAIPVFVEGINPIKSVVHHSTSIG
jgi:hypothetical protein